MKKLKLIFVVFLSIVVNVLAYGNGKIETRAAYMLISVCGNNYTQSGEECDDGNLDDGDGCSSICEVEDIVFDIYPCSDDVDNDGDGFTDEEDPGCHTDWNANNADSYDAFMVGEYEIMRASISSDGAESNDYSYYPAVSDDGQYIVFESHASNLVGGDDTDRNNIFIHNRLTGETKIVSVGYDGGASNSYSYRPSISADGRYIAFSSYADNLVQDDENDKSDIFLFDAWTEEIRRISVTPEGEESNDNSDSPLISSDGRYVQFYSQATNLVDIDGYFSGRYFVCDLQTGEISLVSFIELEDWVYLYPFFSSTSSDGRYMVFDYYRDVLFPGNYNSNIFVYDVLEGDFEKISSAFDGGWADGDSYSPSISDDGRYVAFESWAENIVVDDSNGWIDIFVHDRVSDITSRVSLSFSAEESADDSLYPSISPSGEYITFSSSAWNLVYGDHNGEADVFLVRNPLFGETNSAPMTPTDLNQVNDSDGAEIGVGRIINEGADESVGSVILSAKVEDSDGGRVALEVQIESMDEVSGEWSSFEPIRSEYVSSGEVASIDYDVPGGGLYTWRARTVDEAGKKSDWSHFGNNGIEADFISSNFSFVHITDVHLGSLTTILTDASGKSWYESQSYPRFVDVLYEIENMNPKPDFILIGGDNVEYNNKIWLEDFKSITEDFSKRTGIEIYFVPGNHDRYDSESSAIEWGETDLSGGDDDLFNYFGVMGRPEGVTSFFEDDSSIMDAESSGVGGYNRYNYYFNHKGFQIIGLDSGEDTGVWDFHPESRGIDSRVMNALENLQEGQEKPSIIFLHSPIYNPGDSWEWDNGAVLGGEMVPDASIVNNWRNLVNYCNNHGIQLVLSGHEHNSIVFDRDEDEINLSNWTVNKSFPLYLQTQSSGKDNDINHGYRIINVKNGKAIPQEVETNVTKYEKIYSDLNSDNDLDLVAYDTDGNKITADNNGKTTSFIAPASEHIIILEDTSSSRFEIRNGGSEKSSYDFILQKREEGTEVGHSLVPTSAYLFGNAEVCGDLSPWCLGFVFIQKDNNYVSLKFKDFEIEAGASHKFFADWNNLSDFSISKTSFGIDDDFDSIVLEFKYSLAIDLNSPGELRVYSGDNVTGLVDGEIVENIPHSIYVPESETVYLFGQTQAEITEGIKTQVVGAYEATYDLSISLSENNEETINFTADDILTNNQTTHQFSVDWEALEQGEDGVMMEFDEDGDGEFEKYIFSDETLIFSKVNAKLSAEEYSADEGVEIIFDGSESSDSDGDIVLYEWDFDGDGIYNDTSVSSSIAHTYGDDFEGKIFLRVTDNDGLTDTTSAAVIITNANPTATISRLEMADVLDETAFEKKKISPGRHGVQSDSGVASEMGEFILEGTFTDLGWLDTHSVSINWGDGNTEDVSVTGENSFSDVTRKISARHRYSQLKNYVVELTVEDDDGGMATSEIVLESPRQIKQAALLRLKNIETNNQKIHKEIDKTIKSLEECLKAKYWEDDFHLDSRYLSKFFSEEEKAIRGLEKILGDKKKYADFQDEQAIQEVIDKLNQSNIFLAKIMVYEAGGLTAKNLKSAKSWIDKTLDL